MALSEGNGAQNVLKVLAAGNEKFGYGPAVALATAVSQGLPVKVVALYQTSAPMGVIAYPETPLKVPKDLEGKRLAISVGETFGDMIRPFTRINNVDLSKIQLIQMDASARTMQFLTRKIDVMSVYLSNELPQIEKRAGVKFNVLKVTDFGLKVLGSSMYASNEFAEKNPETVKKLLRATAKGYRRRHGGPQAGGEDDGEAHGGAGAAGRARAAGRGDGGVHQCPGRQADRLADRRRLAGQPGPLEGDRQHHRGQAAHGLLHQRVSAVGRRRHD